MKTNAKRRGSLFFGIILPLSLVILILLSVGSFAWFRNVLTIQGATMNTGQLKYDFEGFYKNSGGERVADFAYSTEQKNGYQLIKLEERPSEPLRSNSTFSVSAGNYGEICYVVSKLDGSIDLNVLLHMNIQKGENVASLDDFIGGFWYQIETTVIETGATPPTAQGQNGQRVLSDSVIEQFGEQEPDPNKNLPMQQIMDNAYSLELSGNSQYCVIRLIYGLNDNATAPDYLRDAENNPISLKIIPELYVEQKGVIREDAPNESITHTVQNLTQLQEAVVGYNVGDTIKIEKSIEYHGDLTFSRPLTLELVSGAELKVYGKMTFTYHGVDSHRFQLNTTNGKISIYPTTLNDEEVGGDFYIDTPYSAFYLIGNGTNDITVNRDKSFDVNVSYTKGLHMIRFTALDQYNALKKINLRNETSVNIDKQSTLGTIGVGNAALYRVAIFNHGSVEDIDLTNMSLDQDVFDQYIVIENHNKIDNEIKLPATSSKYDTQAQSGNTTIVWHQGVSGSMSVGGTSGFGTDDIDKEDKEDQIEKLNETGTQIIVHYMKGWDDQEAPTLESIIERFVTHSDAELQIAIATEIESMAIVCYDDLVLTAADYEFIRSMTSLTNLDLSSAVSSGNALPDNAFANLKDLAEVTLSSTDTSLGTYIFNGTAVNEVTIPINVTSIQATTFTKKIGNIEENIKYIHVVGSGNAKTVLPKTAYIFLPDDDTRNKYIAAGFYRAFVEATRYTTQYGDFFLRYANGGYELVTYADSHADWYRAFDTAPDMITVQGKDSYIRIDMDTLDTGEQSLKIVSIGPYAFYDAAALRLTDANANRFYIRFGDGVKSIGEYAFHNTSALVALEGNGVTYCENYAISACNNLRKVMFTKMNSVGMNNQPFINNCTELFWLETGIVNRKINGSACTVLVKSCSNLSIYLVHSNPTDNYEDMTAVGNRDGSGKMYRIATAGVISLYTTSGVNQNINIGSLGLSDLNFYPAVPANDIFTVPKFVGGIRDGNEEIIVCTRASLEASDVFTDFPSHVERIGDYAFHYLSIYSNTETASLNFPSQVTYVGVGAFKGNNKNYHSLNLNNVITANQMAFESNQMLFVYGPSLQYLGDYAFHAASLYYVELPEWRYSYGAAMNYGYYFWSCGNLKYAYLGPLDNVRNWAFYQCPSLSCVFIDAEKRSPGAVVVPDLGWYNSNTERFIAIVSGGKSVVSSGYGAPSKEVVVDSFEDFIYADFTSDAITVGNVRGNLTYPKSVCVREANNSITYVKSMQKTIEGNYTTPSNVYKLDKDKIAFLGKQVDEYTLEPAGGGIESGTITKIGVNAYFGVTFDVSAKITVAPGVIELGNYAFRECRAAAIDLSSVQKVGSNCFESSPNLHTVTADYVQTLGGYAFINCTNLGEISLPAFVSAGTAPFNGSGVTSITLGKSTENLGTNMFYRCKNLISITIQSPTIPAANNPFSTGSDAYATKLDQISLSVQKSANYLANGATDWKGLPAAQIHAFGNITLIDGAEFYWDFADEAAGTINIVMIRFMDSWQEPSDGKFVIPSFVTETVGSGETAQTKNYYVVGINEASILSIGAQFSYSSLTLPYGMQVMEFSRESLPLSLKEIIIPQAPAGYTGSARFSTVDGVLYNLDQTVLLIYPMAKESTTFTVPATVNTISPYAFSGAYFTTVTIQGPVVIMDGAFENCVSLSTVTFESPTVSVFAGRDIFKNNIALTKIYVPATTLSAYEKNVFYDAGIRALLEEAATAQA